MGGSDPDPEPRKPEKEVGKMEYLILVYPKGPGPRQPKEVWWLQTEEELLERQNKLAAAGEEMVIFEGKIRLLFH